LDHLFDHDWNWGSLNGWGCYPPANKIFLNLIGWYEMCNELALKQAYNKINKHFHYISARFKEMLYRDKETIFNQRNEKIEPLMRREVGDFVNLFWPNLANWSGMLWDRKEFSTMRYELNKVYSPVTSKFLPFSSRRSRLFFRFVPKNFSRVKDMRRLVTTLDFRPSRICSMKYLENISKKDEHFFRIYENFDCWEFESVGATMALYIPALLAGLSEGIEREERSWNAIETKCIGLGHPYCEFKLVPREIDGLKNSLEKDELTIEEMRANVKHRLLEFLIHSTPLIERRKLGSEIHLHTYAYASCFPYLISEKYRKIMGIGGALVGKEIGESIVDVTSSEHESIGKIADLLEYCKVGKILMNETIRIKESCESFYTKMVPIELKEPSCHFTTGFLDGFFSVVKNLHVKETKCSAVGDPYCEWEFQ
jgi:predicted hydrocarbon binding protein